MEWRPGARFWVQSTQKRANFGFKCCAVLSGYGVDISWIIEIKFIHIQ